MYQIEAISYRPQGQKNGADLSSFIRKQADHAVLEKGYGIAGDAKGRKNSGRQLNLLSASWVAARAAEGYKSFHGAFGEQLIISGLVLESLPIGSRLRLGTTAVIEIAGPRDGCSRLQQAQEREDPLLLGHIGVLARVIQGGEIHQGDPVTLFVEEAVKDD